MTPNAEAILKSEVYCVRKFHTTSYKESAMDEGSWQADFKLQCGQGFHVYRNETEICYEPYSTNNFLPEVKQISWIKHLMGFGGRGAPFMAEVKLVEETNSADKAAYEKILMPLEVDEGRWVPYPRYTYVPMLTTALNITSAWKQRQRAIQTMKVTEKNMADALALRTLTYDLRQHC